MALEINLVPDIKGEMIKALKLRNLIFFICIVVASASVVVSLVLATIAGGQQAVVDGKKGTISLLSEKVKSYDDLSDFLTVKDQLDNIGKISDNKQLLSRIFGALAALLPTGPDSITLSELSVNFTGELPTISFDAQANAGAEPFIDYNVLDSFKKSMQYMRYDYGEYVDRYERGIPAYCMIETGTDGATFYESGKGNYAYWLIEGEGCNPSIDQLKEEYGENEDDEEDTVEDDEDTENAGGAENAEPEAKPTTLYGYQLEEYEGNTVVKVWRTPQYNDWYKTEETYEENGPYMNLDGEIQNVPHFESQCTKYYGVEDDAGKVTWGSTNTDCMLVPDGVEGIRISDSSNGRGADGELVLRFSATITLNPEVFSFNNKHVLSIAPSGRHNVTDSFVQIQNMFAERAADCAPGDTACNNATNMGGKK